MNHLSQITLSLIRRNPLLNLYLQIPSNQRADLLLEIILTSIRSNPPINLYLRIPSNQRADLLLLLQVVRLVMIRKMQSLTQADEIQGKLPQIPFLILPPSPLLLLLPPPPVDKEPHRSPLIVTNHDLATATASGEQHRMGNRQTLLNLVLPGIKSVVFQRVVPT